MPDTYDVLPAEVAAELKGLFPQGFTSATVPTETEVEDFISTADDIVRLHIQDATGQVPALSDAAVRIVKTYIKEWTKSQVVRSVYAGRDPTAVTAASQPYRDLATQILKDIDVMGLQVVGPGAESPKIAVAYVTPVRELAVTDDELDMDNNFRTRKY